MKTIGNTASQIKFELKENEKKSKSTSENLTENNRSINMKQFWNNINSLGFKSSPPEEIQKNDPFLIRHLIELFSQPDLERDKQMIKTGFPRNFSLYLNKYLEKYNKKCNIELIDKICGFNLYLEKNKYNFKTNSKEINTEIASLEKILSNLEDINYNNGLKIQKYTTNQEKLENNKKKKKGLYSPESILTNDIIYDNLINQIYNLQMKQFAESICNVQRKKVGGEWIYKIILEINDSLPSLEMSEKEYQEFIQYRDPLNSISIYDLFQEKIHSYYNTDKLSSKYNNFSLEEVFAKSRSVEKKTKNSKKEIRGSRNHLHSHTNKKSNKNNKKSKHEENKNYNFLFDYQIGQKTNIEYFYCHHCKQRKPTEFIVKCKSGQTETKFCQKPFKSYVINGTTVIRSKSNYLNFNFYFI